METAWNAFHVNKNAFAKLGVRTSFNIPKLHSMSHYVRSIRLMGSADGYNTEATERMHIDFAKLGYRASNKKQYIKQMTVWLERQEAVHRFEEYLAWLHPQLARSDAFADDESDHEAVDDEGDREPGVAAVKEVHGTSHETVVNAAFPRVPVGELQYRFGATRFAECLQAYLVIATNTTRRPAPTSSPARQLSPYSRNARSRCR